MLNQLKTGKKQVGIKQSTRALREGNVQSLYVAENADSMVIRPIIDLAEDAGIPVVSVETMEILGEACGIQVGAAVAVLLK